MQVKLSPLSQPILFTRDLFFTSCLPLLVGIFCDSLVYLVEEKDSSFLTYQNLQGLENQGNFLVLFIKQAKEISYGAYSSFLQFMITMLSIHLVSLAIQRLKSFTKDDHVLSGEDRRTFETRNPPGASSGFRKINSIVLHIFGYILAYCIIFSLASFNGTRTEEANTLEQHFKLDNDGDFRLARILEEEIYQNNDQSLKVNKKNFTTFPLGRVLGSLNIDASSIVFSKDETTMFATSKSFFGVISVNISDWENPNVIRNSVLLPKEKLSKVSLLISPDNKALFVSNMDYFAKYALDDSNLLHFNPDYSIVPALPKDLNVKFETSLAFSPDGTKIFAAGYGLQIFNTSSETRKVNQIRYELPLGEVTLSTAAVSLDGKSLFVLNGTLLKIYNISDINNWKLISSFETENTPCSFIQSKDKKKLIMIGFEKGTNKVVIERVDVSNVLAPKLIKTIPLNIESFSSLFGLGESPKETYLYFTIKESNEDSETKMMIFDTSTERLLEDSQNMISRAKSLLFTSDESKVMAVFDESITAIQLYQNYPNDRIFSISKETVAEVSTVAKSKNRMLKEFSSSNGKFLLSVDEIEDGTRFTFTDISNYIEINSFSTGDNLVSVSITNDGKKLFVSFNSKIILYDISDMKAPNILGTYAFGESQKILDAVFTSDGKTCFVMMTNGATSNLKVFDFSDSASIKETDSFFDLFMLPNSSKVMLILSKDEKYLCAIDQFIGIFDVSARKISRTKSSIRYFDVPAGMHQSFSFSPGGEILIIKREDARSSNLFLLEMRYFHLAGEFRAFALPKPKIPKKIPVRFTPDGKLAYVEGVHDGLPSLLVLNISNPNSIIFQSVIQTEGGSVDNFIISDDGHTAYLASNSENKIYVTNIETSNTVYLGTESFRLGEKSSTDVMVLKQNNHGDYVLMDKNYKFVKASLFSTKIVSTEYSIESKFTPFPYWMTFQKETGSFMIEPKKQSDLKSYTLYTAFSTQLNRSSFDRIDYFKGNDDHVQSLLVTLVTFGYLDSDLYVTGNFGTLENFFFAGEGREKIYQILKENYFETFTIFDIVPSLEVRVDSKKKKLEIQTASYNSLKIELSITGGMQFLNKQYGPLVPLITENKTRLAIEGSVDDVNSALKNLVVNSERNDFVCAGTLIIWDRLNPSIGRTLKNLSSYFEINEAPIVNESVVQEQINSKIYETGKEFSLNFSKATFIDKYSENLRFTLTLDDKERSSVSDWLTFNDGILKGTPKKELFNRRKNLLLTVKNEFKQIEVPFTLEAKLSLEYILELLLKYSPYILTVVSIWIFANRIYNVLKKDKYRHCKDFYISVGKEITAQDIYPISFIGQEGAEGELIWKHLVKKGLDKSNIMEEIKKVVEKLPEKNLVLYKEGSDVSRKLINQLIMNQMALWLIGSKEEKETKRIYEEEIECQLMDLVKWDSHGYCQINEVKFYDIFKKIPNRDATEEEGLETELISQNVINVDLLRDVVIAKAMECQSIRKKAFFTHLVIREEETGNWIKRFLTL